jgi:hypothetical protein
MFSFIMTVHLEHSIAFGQLQIDANEQEACIQIWNFASGSKAELTVQGFGAFQDFGQTLEQLFFLFAHQSGCRIVGFESSTNVSKFLNIN